MRRLPAPVWADAPPAIRYALRTIASLRRGGGLEGEHASAMPATRLDGSKVSWQARLAALLAAALCAPAGCARSDGGAGAVAAAKSLLATGKQSQGLELLNAALAQNPRNVEARLLRLEELHRRGLLPLALADLQAGRKVDPALGDWAVWEAKLRFASREDQTGLEVVARVPIEKVDFSLRMDAARGALRLERPDAALHWLNLAVEADPKASDPRLERSVLLADSGEFAAAQSDLAPFAEEGKTFDPRAKVFRAYVFRKQGDRAAAAADCRAALERMPLYWRAHLEHARLLRDQGESEAALKEFQLAADLASEDPAPRVERGELLLQLGRLDEARGEIEAAARMTPVRGSVRFAEGRIEFQSRKFGLAKKAFDALLVLNPRHAAGYNARGRIQRTWEAWDGALADFAEAIRIGPPTSEHLLDRADALRKLGRANEAQADEARAVELAAKEVERATK